MTIEIEKHWKFKTNISNGTLYFTNCNIRATAGTLYVDRLC